jgi:hypothetical protein
MFAEQLNKISTSSIDICTCLQDNVAVLDKYHERFCLAFDVLVLWLLVFRCPRPLIYWSFL